MTHVADENTLKERVAKCEKNEHGNVTDLRRAAEQALDVMEYNRSKGTPNMGAAIEALRKALAQPKWVGLTDADIKEGADLSRLYPDQFEPVARWAESKLKEKNHGAI